MHHSRTVAFLIAVVTAVVFNLAAMAFGGEVKAGHTPAPAPAHGGGR